MGVTDSSAAATLKLRRRYSEAPNSRYTHSRLVGVVRGVGNSRGEVIHDPANPVQAAEDLGREFFRRDYSDYRLETPRSPKVWGEVRHTQLRDTS